MTIKEASELVIRWCDAKVRSFLLDMGQPIKIYDLAKKMIKLSGLQLKDKYKLNGDIEILITGLRPGENYTKNFNRKNKSLSTVHLKYLRPKMILLGHL